MSSLLGFSFVSVLNLSFSASLQDELISSLTSFPYLISQETCLLIAPSFLPHTGGIQPLNSTSPCSPPVFEYMNLCPLRCANPQLLAPSSKSSAQAAAQASGMPLS